MIKVLSFLSNENCFTGHSTGPCGPRFEHRCSKDSYYSVISNKNFSQKIGLAQGLMTSFKITLNLPHLWCTHKKRNSKPVIF